MATARGNQIKARRLEERLRMFGECDQEVWHQNSRGFAQIPRLLPLVMLLIAKGSAKAKGNPARVYLDLWTRVFEAGYVRIVDESDCAYTAGYDGERGLRTWREHMKYLKAQGFIKVAESGNKPFAYVLMIDPYLVVARKLAAGQLKDKAWINSFVQRIGEVGAILPIQLKIELNKVQPGAFPLPAVPPAVASAV